MIMDLEARSQSDVSRTILEASQHGPFPYRLMAFGLTLEVDPDVFSPLHFHGWEIFTRAFPDVRGQRVLEIGCGTGVTSLYAVTYGAVHVVAVDINPAAVENTRRNIALNSLAGIDVRRSDVFSAIEDHEQFDTIYWNMPFLYQDDAYTYRSVLERGLFDPGYRLTRRYLAEAGRFLAGGGRVLAGMGDFADLDRFHSLCAFYCWRSRVLASEASVEGNPVTFDLYELTSQRQ